MLHRTSSSALIKIPVGLSTRTLIFFHPRHWSNLFTSPIFLHLYSFPATYTSHTSYAAQTPRRFPRATQIDFYNSYICKTMDETES